MPTVIPSYPQIYQLGHRYISELLDGKVSIEEKVDGSQFNFGVYMGHPWCRSKGCQIDPAAPQDSMFNKATEAVLLLAPILIDGWTYSGEYLSKPKHNTAPYDRTPIRNIIIFDISTSLGAYLPYNEKKKEATRIGLECVPLLYEGEVSQFSGLEMLGKFLERESCLGGSLIEGVVIKNYNKFGQDKKVLMGKYVSPKFVEVHQQGWKDRHPVGRDVKDSIIVSFKSEARWAKAVQHLKESGAIKGEPQDIPLLLKEINEDVLRENESDIKDMLLKWAWKDVSRGITKGMAEWYKTKLTEGQFGENKQEDISQKEE